MRPQIHIIRHGEALHNIQRNYPNRDPPLTKSGHHSTKNIHLTARPDLILISPMTRTLQTAINIFPFLAEQAPFKIPVQIWPDLCETYDSICNNGLSRKELEAGFPQFDFNECHAEWDYAGYEFERATKRAERVRKRLKGLEGRYANIAVVTHREFKEFLVKGKRFGLAEVRRYRWATEEEAKDERVRWGVNSDSLGEQDFGPTVLVLDEGKR